MAANVSSPFSVATASEVWYFAYGSNMRPSVMTNRGLSPLATEKALIPSHVLTFDVFGVPYSEPAMASIAEGPTSSICESYGDSSKIPPVHGIAYLLPLAEYKNLVISEGAGIAYRESELTGCLLAAQGIHGNVQRKIVMRTLVAKYPFRPNAAPSKRYLNILVEGAREHSLPSYYQAFLKSLPDFDPSRDLSTRGKLGAKLFLVVWPPLIHYLMRWIKARAKSRTTAQTPEWASSLVCALFGIMWFYHDSIHCRLWGRGDGGRFQR